MSADRRKWQTKRKNIQIICFGLNTIENHCRKIVLLNWNTKKYAEVINSHGSNTSKVVAESA